MNIADMSLDAELLVKTSDQRQIAVALHNALGDEIAFKFVEPVLGTPRSGRMFSVMPHPRGQPIVQELIPRLIAHELMRLVDDARYDGEGAPGERKGWAIYKCVIEGKPAALAWAAWTPN